MGIHWKHPRGTRKDLEKLITALLLVLPEDDGLISPENMAMLRYMADEHSAKRKHYYKPRRFRRLVEFSDEECKHLFMFESKDDIRQLMHGLHIPDRFQRENRGYVSGEEAFLIMLMRFVYPGRWCQHMETFGGSAGFLSETFYLVLEHIHSNESERLLGDLSRYSPLFPMWADAIATKRGEHSANVWGFIDGTLRKMCRPTHNQREVYSGHKRCHGLKYQSVSAPCGLIVDLFGPIPGRRHDMYLLDRITHL